jgi:hypothetical protein
MKRYLPAALVMLVLIGGSIVVMTPWQDPYVRRMMAEHSSQLWASGVFVLLYVPWLVLLFDKEDPWARQWLSRIEARLAERAVGRECFARTCIVQRKRLHRKTSRHPVPSQPR